MRRINNFYCQLLHINEYQALIKLYTVLSEFKLLLRVRLTKVTVRSFAVSRLRFVLVALWQNKFDLT